MSPRLLLPQLHLRLAWLYDKRYNWAEAHKHCMAALALAPNLGTARAQLAAELIQQVNITMKVLLATRTLFAREFNRRDTTMMRSRHCLTRPRRADCLWQVPTIR
jgi:hypothetical protein